MAPAGHEGVGYVAKVGPAEVAVGATVLEAYHKALACDPLSAFGGIVACNRPLDGEAASEISRIFTEVVIAPGVEPAARDIFAMKAGLRLLTLEHMPDPVEAGPELKWLMGGFLLQDRDTARLVPGELRVATQRPPTPEELADLLFAWQVVRHVKSNAIVLARGSRTEEANIDGPDEPPEATSSFRISPLKALVPALPLILLFTDPLLGRFSILRTLQGPSKILAAMLIGVTAAAIIALSGGMDAIDAEYYVHGARGQPPA